MRREAFPDFYYFLFAGVLALAAIIKGDGYLHTPLDFDCFGGSLGGYGLFGYVLTTSRPELTMLGMCPMKPFSRFLALMIFYMCLANTWPCL